MQTYYIVPSLQRKIQLIAHKDHVYSKEEAFLNLASYILKGSDQPKILFTESNKTLDFLFITICLENINVSLGEFFNEESDFHFKGSIVAFSQQILNTIKNIILHNKTKEFESAIKEPYWSELLREIKGERTKELLELLKGCYELYREKELDFKTSPTAPKEYFFTPLSAVEELYEYLRKKGISGNDIYVEYEDIPEIGLYEPLYKEILNLLNAKLVDRTKDQKNRFPPNFKAFATLIDEAVFILEEFFKETRLKGVRGIRNKIALVTTNTDLLTTLRIVSRIKSKELFFENTLGETSYFQEFLSKYESISSPNLTPKEFIQNTNEKIPSELSKFNDLIETLDDAVDFVTAGADNLKKTVSNYVLKQNHTLTLQTKKPFLITKNPADILTCDLNSVFICGLNSYGDLLFDFWLPYPLQERIQLKNDDIQQKTINALEYISTYFPTTLSYSYLVFSGDNVAGVSNSYIYLREKLKQKFGNHPNFQDTKDGIYLTYTFSSDTINSTTSPPSAVKWCILDLIPNVNEIHLSIPELSLMFNCHTYAALRITAQRAMDNGIISLASVEGKVMKEFLKKRFFTPLIQFIVKEIKSGKNLQKAFESMDENLTAQSKSKQVHELINEFKNISQDTNLAQKVEQLFDPSVNKIMEIRIPIQNKTKTILLITHNLVVEESSDNSKTKKAIKFVTRKTLQDLIEIFTSLTGKNNASINVNPSKRDIQKIYPHMFEDILRIGLAFKHYQDQNVTNYPEFKLVTIQKGEVIENSIPLDMLKKFYNYVNEELNKLINTLTIEINHFTSRDFKKSCGSRSCNYYRNCQIFLNLGKENKKP